MKFINDDNRICGLEYIAQIVGKLIKSQNYDIAIFVADSVRAPNESLSPFHVYLCRKMDVFHDIEDVETSYLWRFGRVFGKKASLW